MVDQNSDLFKEEYPFSSKFKQINNLQYHYIDEGEGAPVIMVHGNPSWSFYFRNLVKRLSKNYRCIVPDHIGCGFSARPDDSQYDFRLKSRVDDLTSFIDSLNITEKITIIAHDWGGMISTAWAVNHVERVEKLVMLNTAAFHLPEKKRFPFALSLIRDSLLGKVLVERFNAFSVGASIIGCKMSPMSKALREVYQMPYAATKNDRLATLKFVLDIPLKPSDSSYQLVSDTQAKLHRLQQVPILLGWGLKDFVFDRHFLAQWQTHFPKAESVIYPNAGHYVLEDAGSDLEEKIYRFLKTGNI